MAVIGTEAVRRGWRIRPRRVSIRCGRPLTFPRVQGPSPQLAVALTERIWPCVNLQWEWLGGQPPLRRAAVIGAGAWGTSVAVMLARAGLDVELGCRTAEQARELDAARQNARYLPGVPLPEGLRVARAGELELGAQDLVCLAVPARALPATLGAHGSNVPARAGVLVLSKGLVGPLGALPSDYVAERVPARAVASLGGPAHAAEALGHGASLVLAAHDPAFARQLRDALCAGGFDVQVTADVVGAELAGVAKNAAALAAAAAAGAGPNGAGAVAGKVFAEAWSYARSRGAEPEAFTGLAGAGDLVGTVLAAGSRNRRAGDLIAQSVPGHDVGGLIGQATEGLDTVPLLADALRAARVPAPTIEGLAAVIDGREDVGRWSAAVTAPAPSARGARAA